MGNILKQRHFPQNMMTHFIFFSMCYPIYTSKMQSLYSPDIIVANIFAVLFITTAAYQRRIAVSKNRLFLLTMSLALLGFNICSVYVNQLHLNWYYGQINVSISFLLFLTLLLMDDERQKENILDLLIKVVVISNAIGLIPYFFNYYGISVGNLDYYFIPMEGQFDERRYNWIYSHKSEYSLMLMLFLALIINYRHRFHSKKQFLGSIAVMIVGLLIANTRTSIVASLGIFTGWLLDEIIKQPKAARKRYAFLLIPIAVAMVGMLFLIAQKRDLLSLGSRTYIWKAALTEIRENPHGIGTLCGLRSFPISVWPWDVWNCHNVFLNILLQFSIPAGLFYIVMLLLIIAASIVRKPSFLTLGTWAALLVALNMDWSLLLQRMSLFLLTVYFLFFFKSTAPNRTVSTDSNSVRSGK